MLPRLARAAGGSVKPASRWGAFAPFLPVMSVDGAGVGGMWEWEDMVRVRVLIVCGLWSRQESNEIWRHEFKEKRSTRGARGITFLSRTGVACVIPSSLVEASIGEARGGRGRVVHGDWPDTAACRLRRLE
jgi:hypothetical protein